MGFETGLTTHLENNVPSVSNRIYPDTLPQGATLPALTYRRITGIPEYAHTGSSDLEDGRYELNIWASTPLQRLSTYSEVRVAVSGFKGSFGDKTCTCFIRNHFSLYEPDTEIYREVIELKIWHRESA